MVFFGNKHETEMVLYSYEVEPTESIIPDENLSLTLDRHCAWCGDPPDENGSHGICEFHTNHIIEQARARKRGRS